MSRNGQTWCLLMVLGTALAGGCESGGADAQIEKLPDIKPNLPAVPTLPPPPHPVQYPDQSYSVYGLRKRMRQTIDNEVQVTGYIVDVYQPPECPKGKQCPLPTAPHLYLADTPAETDPEKRLLLVGYAENQKAIDEAVKLAKKGRYEPPDPESGMLPIPTDFFKGAKINVKGQFAHVSGAGFAQSDGLLDYRAHTTLEAAPEPE